MYQNQPARGLHHSSNAWRFIMVWSGPCPPLPCTMKPQPAQPFNVSTRPITLSAGLVRPWVRVGARQRSPSTLRLQMFSMWHQTPVLLPALFVACCFVPWSSPEMGTRPFLPLNRLVFADCYQTERGIAHYSTLISCLVLPSSAPLALVGLGTLCLSSNNYH